LNLPAGYAAASADVVANVPDLRRWVAGKYPTEEQSAMQQRVSERDTRVKNAADEARARATCEHYAQVDARAQAAEAQLALIYSRLKDLVTHDP
jgi:hypothetical protein